MTTLDIILASLLLAMTLFALLFLIVGKRQNKRKINYVLERLKESNDEKLRFYTNITHELKSPLTLIIGPLETILQDPQLPEELQKTLSNVYENSKNLLSLVNQCLDFRKVETNNWNFRVCYDNISKKVQDICYPFISTNTNQSISFVLDIEDNIKLYFDPKIIQIILSNFLSNAIKHTSKGTITVYCRKREYNKSMFVVIGVADTGSGIPKKELKHIFERYYQGESSQFVAGTGIGLSMVKSLADIHEMSITVDSMIGKGSNFSVSMGMDNTYPSAEHYDLNGSGKEEDEETSLSAIDRELSVDEFAEGDSRPILVAIDDNSGMTSYIADILKDDCRVYIASNGIQGIRMIIKLIPDIIICDIMMPFMDGFEVCERVKRDLRTSHIPVLLLTAKDSDEDKIYGYAVGADSYITKPFSAELLRSRVKNLLDSHKRMAKHVIVSTLQKKTTTDKTMPGHHQIHELSKIDKEFIDKITQMIKDGISTNELDVNTIAAKMCMSQSTLYRKIKGLMGITANEFIRKIRLTVAAELIKSGTCNVSEAAWRVNMNNPSYFRKCFKEEFGVFPSQYKKKAGQSQ